MQHVNAYSNVRAKPQVNREGLFGFVGLRNPKIDLLGIWCG